MATHLVAISCVKNEREKRTNDKRKQPSFELCFWDGGVGGGDARAACEKKKEVFFFKRTLPI